MALEELLNEIKAMKDNKAQQDEFIQGLSRIIDIIDAHRTDTTKQLEQHKALIAEAARQMNERVASLKDGENPKDEQLLALIKSLIPQVKDGVSPEIDDIVDEVMGRIQLPEQKAQILDPYEIRDKLAGLPEEDRLYATDIKAIRESVADQKVTRIVSNHGPLYSLIDVNVTGLTSGQVLQWNGTQWVPVTVSGAGGGYQSPTGTVDGNNKVFVFTSAPSAVCVDGVVLRATAKDGTVNWTGTTTITLTVAPTFEVFGVA